MLGQFLATFAGVILSFLLWFGGERIVRYQHEKKARAHLIKEVIAEIKENVVLLDSFANFIEQSLKKKNLPLFGLKLNISARASAISSGELRLISDSKQRQLIRNSAYHCEEFNHFIENTELLLAIINLKAQPQALTEANYRLKQLKEQAKETAAYSQDIIDKLTSPQK